MYQYSAYHELSISLSLEASQTLYLVISRCLALPSITVWLRHLSTSRFIFLDEGSGLKCMKLNEKCKRIEWENKHVFYDKSIGLWLCWWRIVAKVPKIWFCHANYYNKTGFYVLYKQYREWILGMKVCI